MGFCFNIGAEAPRNSLEMEEEEPSLPSSKDEKFYVPVSFSTIVIITISFSKILDLVKSVMILCFSFGKN